MSTITIPIKNYDGSEWGRLDLEKWLRANVITKGHAVLIKMACVYGLDPIYAQNVCTSLLLHWLLDKIITDSKSADSIKCKGEKMGLPSSINSKKAEGGIRVWKIKGMDDPRGDLEQYMKDFHEKLAHFVGHGWAVRPEEGEGIDLDLLDRLMGTSTPQWNSIPLPVIPSNIPTVSVVSYKDPSIAKKVKRVVDVQDIENIQAEITKTREEVARNTGRLDGHENRIAMLEMVIRAKD
jgi:hypothetical protein